MKFAIAGATGFVGSALVERLQAAGHDLVLLVRDPARAARWAGQPGVEIVVYDPLAAGDWQGALAQALQSNIAGCDGVVNLAGAPIAEGRWTPARRAEIRTSRSLGTQRLVEAIAQASPQPAVLVNASAIGYYGSSEQAVFTEASPAGTGFLAEVCQDWEAAAQALSATEGSPRVVIFRTGIVLGNGGALGKMLPAFRAFAGGCLGTGRQWFSWIALEDLVSLLERALTDPTWNGVYNATAPNPLRMGEFCQVLARLVERPAWLPVPGWVLEVLLGDASQVVLEGQQVLPQRAIAAGFSFAYPQVEAALDRVLN